jgi:hypothetical protein
VQLFHSYSIGRRACIQLFWFLPALPTAFLHNTAALAQQLLVHRAGKAAAQAISKMLQYRLKQLGSRVA